MLGSLLIPQIEKSIKKDYGKTVFSFIPNTAETSFYGLIERAKKYNPRIEKIAVKDAKLRTFISADKGREDLVAHVYDITYGVIQNSRIFRLCRSGVYWVYVSVTQTNM